MSALAETIPEAVGDWTLRGMDVDQIFAQPRLSDDALTAACMATARFDPAFPGWQLYRRIVAGFTLHDAELDAWAVSTGRLLAQARRRDGRAYIAKAGAWVDTAARDALAAVVTGQSPTETPRALVLDVDLKTYRRIKHPLAACMEVGMQTFRAELLSKLYFVRRIHIAESDVNLSWERPLTSADFPVSTNRNDALFWGSGNTYKARAPDPDNL
jgi:hypothetical protein